MKILISYPPLNNQKGFPTLGQNRQFQFFKKPTYIYPVVPASAATLLKEAGHAVIWNDCIAQGWGYKEFLNFIVREKPDLIAFETKTPVVKQHWKIINDIKGLSPSSTDRDGSPITDRDGSRQSNNESINREPSLNILAGTLPKIVLFGDHVTALPEESFQNSKVDFVLTGGDYDFLLLNLCNALNMKGLSPKGTVPDNIELEPGIYYRENGQIKSTGPFQLNHDLNSLPFIDRDLTKWQLYAYENGNYKRAPGTYIMSGRDCWWGKCTFCGWGHFYPRFRARRVENVLEEIGSLIHKYKVREIMDDTGSFPAGEWLRQFCKGAIQYGFNKKIYLDCNMRFGTLSYEDLCLMKKANFRLLLFGLESANQNTLDRVNKNLKVEDIIDGCKLARRAGLFPHITVMFGYPWETFEEALNTLRLGRWLLKKGYAHTMQATIVIPYPGTPLFEECKEKGLLDTLDWDKYDMKAPVMRAQIPEEEISGLVQHMYKASFNPEFILRKLFSLRDLDDVKYGFRALKKVTGHIFDFHRVPLTKSN